MPTKFTLLVTVALIAIVPNLSFAQFVWVDQHGVKQFSDTPPPSNTPRNRIIKTPNFSHLMEDKEKSTSQSPTNKDDEKLQKPQTATAQNDAMDKRRTEEAEKASKTATEKKIAEDKATNCERARAYQQTLQNGMPVTKTNQNGERGFLDEAQRAKDLADTKRVTADCK